MDEMIPAEQMVAAVGGPTIGCSSSTGSAVAVQTVSGDKRRSFACFWPECDFRAKRRDIIRRHQSIHSSVRAFTCDYDGCGKRFKRKDTLTEHQACHVKRFPCDFRDCDKDLATVVCPIPAIRP